MNGPEGVRIHRADGTVIDCELIHEGVNDDGVDNWLIAGVEYHPERGDVITIEVFPPRCGLGFRMPTPDD